MAKRNILGLDLGTTSIGWAYVIEGETPQESSIEQLGVRVNPLTVDEQINFERGRPLTTNADRTLKRGARRNLDRYQQRRENLVEILRENEIISENTSLNEDGKNTTFQTWELRAKAANEKIEPEQFARVLLAINKKRGYKSSRKAKNEDEGQVIDGMGIARRLYEENLTPGLLVYENYKNGLKAIPDFYRSDLLAEFDKIWNYQKQFYPEFLTDELREAIMGQGMQNTRKRIFAIAGIGTADIKDYDDSFKNKFAAKFDKRTLRKIQAYEWRSKAVTEQIDKEQLAYILVEINNDLDKSSGYLGAIADRSKKLYFNNQTVGQYLYRQLLKDRHTSLKNQVFYRQDYLDEFEKIWETQAAYYPILTNELKEEIRDVIIFYQRKLKSQKGLISFCELESKKIISNGKEREVGLRVAPRSSPLFQEFKIRQVLHNVVVRKKGSRRRKVSSKSQTELFETEAEIFELDLEHKEILFDELNLKGNLKADRILSILGFKSSEVELNYPELEGNRTNQALYNAYLKILEFEGYNEELIKLSDDDIIDVSKLKTPAVDIKDMVKQIFDVLGIDTAILEFDATLQGKNFEKQAAYQLWHILYSAEDDLQKYSEKDIMLYGHDNINLKKQLCEKFGFKPDHAKIIANVVFQDDYGNLSTKAMRRIYPYILENNYSTACELAEYRHSKHSLTKEEIENRELKPRLDLLKKNSLRNPVVEKILNQMINVVNALIDKENDKLERAGKERNFQFDEIRIELARELKRSAKERAEMTAGINAATLLNERIRKILQSEFHIPNPTRNDVIRYKLYEELSANGYKDLYTDCYIPKEKLFSKEIDIEHIIPQSRLFDDSLSNKTIVYRQENIKKGNRTAYDYIEADYGEEKLQEYISRVEDLFLNKALNKAKRDKLLKRAVNIGDGFVERDLRNTQYIAKKAKEILFEITRIVTPTTGSITDRLREDWDLINVMKELNLPKYRLLGLTEMEERKYGREIEVIKDWTKRNDHRHHAVDALTVAFTKRSFIQYLNNLNARLMDESQNRISNTRRNAKSVSDLRLSSRDVRGIEEKELHRDSNGKMRFNAPMENFRQIAKEHLESILVSHKAKNKVITRNKNKIRTLNGERIKVELTPRGQLHKETVYGKYQFYRQKKEKISSRFDRETIEKVSNPLFRKLLLERLAENDNDPRKAFGGKNAISKKPIHTDAEQTKLMPEKVKLVWLEEDYSIRKVVNPENFKNDKLIEKILDEGIKRKLKARLKEYNDDPKMAFSDLDTNPIWLNKDKGIAIKRVAISGVKNAESLGHKKDHFGDFILDETGNKIPADFVSTGNNHHVAIYREPVLDKQNIPVLDDEGNPTYNLQEKVVSFFEAVERVNQGLPVIDKTYNQHLGWEFLFTMKQNELFVFPNEDSGFHPHEKDLLDPKNKKEISPNLFRVQKFTIRDYFFRHHLETTVETDSSLKNNTWKREGLNGIKGIIKVRVNHLGDIIHVGEY